LILKSLLTKISGLFAPGALGRLDGARITEYVRANYRELLEFLAQNSGQVRSVAAWAAYDVGKVPLAPGNSGHPSCLCSGGTSA